MYVIGGCTVSARRLEVERYFLICLGKKDGWCGGRVREGLKRKKQRGRIGEGVM